MEPSINDQGNMLPQTENTSSLSSLMKSTIESMDVQRIESIIQRLRNNHIVGFTQQEIDTAIIKLTEVKGKKIESNIAKASQKVDKIFDQAKQKSALSNDT